MNDQNAFFRHLGPRAGSRKRSGRLGQQLERLGKRLLFPVSVAIALLIAALVVRTVGYSQPRLAARPAPSRVFDLPDGAAERLAGSLRIRTISSADAADRDPAAFVALHDYLAAAFPRVHAELRREQVHDYSLLYTWQGSDPSLRPILLLGHLDVVPIEPGSEEKWEQAPFGGRIAGGFIWGRGAIDNKSAVVGTLEAVEMLIRDGFRPARTVYLAYGHDEEVGGMEGAREIAMLLRRRGVVLESVLDEGGVVGDGILPGIAEPVALVGIAEKGFVSVALESRTPGGHSSLPPDQSAIGIVSAAIARLEANPMRARLSKPTQQLFDSIGPRFALPQRAIFANLWLTEPVVLRALTERPTTNAMIRTTTAATIFQAGTKDNVLPSEARAVLNFRIVPGDSVDGVVEHVRRVVDDDRVEISVTGRFSAEPSAVSATESEGFRVLERTIRSVAPDAIVAPYLVVVATDSRHFSDLSRNLFRFLPLRLTPGDLERMHGTNERLAITEYGQAIRMYRELIVNVAGG